jgi:molecular chaperone GrpE
VTERNDEQEPVVVRDRRRIDPVTGEVRAPGGGRPSPGAGGQTAAPQTAPEGEPDPADTKMAELAAQLDERTADLQRVSAEYANYRRRVDRDRSAVVAEAKASVAADLLTALDDVARAEQHGDLTGAFKSVADKVLNALTKAGLEAFGAEGDPFDPSVHEAVQHTTSAEVAGPTVSLVMRQGFRIGERVLRPAMVAVTDRDPDAPDLPGPSSGAENEDNG